MSYTNPAIATNKNFYDQELEVQDGYSTVILGPIKIPDVTITGGALNVIGNLNVTGNTNITDTLNSNGSLNLVW